MKNINYLLNLLNNINIKSKTISKEEFKNLFKMSEKDKKELNDKIDEILKEHIQAQQDAHKHWVK